jgi:hypothetical protein
MSRKIKRSKPRTADDKSRPKNRPRDAASLTSTPADPRFAVSLGVVLGLLALLRAVTPLVPSMHAWGLNLMRFSDPLLGWALWAAAALALLPLVGQRGIGLAGSLGEWIARGRLPVTLGLAAFAALLVLLFPERLQFVGDFGLRERAVTEAVVPVELYPGGPGQALPLDLAIHHRIPHLLVSSGLLSPNGAGRLLGALLAAGYAVLSMVFVRRLGAQGVAATAALAVALFGGYLGLFTGFNKSFADMCLIAVAVGALGVGVARTGKGLLPLAIVAALGILTHRMALGFLPALGLAWVLWFRHHRQITPRPAFTAAASLAIPLLALATMLPRLAGTLIDYDLTRNVFRTGEPGPGTWLAGHLVDVANVAILMSPLCLLGLVLLIRGGGRLWRARETWLLLAIAIPFVVVTPLLRPEMGVFRLWDFFAVLGVTLSLVTAWLVADGFRANPKAAWLALAVVLAVAAPTLQWLALHTDRDRGLERIEAFVSEPPPRTELERAATWDFLGLAHAKDGRWEDAARAYGASAEAGPSPRVLFAWATSLRKSGNLESAREVYERVVAKDPDSLDGWIGLGAVSWELGDVAGAGRAATEVLRLDPTNPTAKNVLEYLQQNPAAADSAASTNPAP